MRRRLVAFGCSYAYGHGLSDCHERTGQPGPQPSKFSWPSLLATKLDRECINLSQCGLSNKAIWHRIVNTSFTPSDVVVIGWSYPERWCIIRSESDSGSVEDIGPWIKGKIHRVFYTKLYNEVDMNVDFNLRISHAMMHLDNAGIENYHTLIEPNTVQPLSWNNTPILPVSLGAMKKRHKLALDRQHPGPDAHKEYADQLYQEITENK
jgi:hypothetical protein